VNLHAHLCEVLLDTLGAIRQVLEELLRDEKQSLLGPSGEPVEGTTVDKRWEVSATDSQDGADGRHTETDVQVLPDQSGEQVENVVDVVNNLPLSTDGSDSILDLILIFIGHQVGDLSSVQQVIQILDERLTNDLSVC
jgi:hypothetical protein